MAAQDPSVEEAPQPQAEMVASSESEPVTPPPIVYELYHPLRPVAHRVCCATTVAVLFPAVTTKHQRMTNENIYEEAARHRALK